MGRRLLFEAQRSIAFGSIGAGYADIGTVMANPIRMIMIDNLTDANLQFSIDGTNDHFVVAANSGKVLDLTANKVDRTGFVLAEGTAISVKRIGTPTTGSVYLSVMYGRGD